MILGISGLAGSGKDSVADALAEFRFQKIALADPIKRTAMDWLGFDKETLWGKSEFRSKPDTRYPREHNWMKNGKCACCGADVSDSNSCFLSLRYFLQLAGTELGRFCYKNIWIDYAMRTAKELISTPGMMYTPAEGVVPTVEQTAMGEWSRDDATSIPCTGVVIVDERFINEFKATKEQGGKVIRIKRPGYEKPRWNHPSETEQLQMPDEEFDYIFHNDGTLEDIPGKVQEMLNNLAL